MKVDAPAKINLGLHVLRRRSDRFHDLETVMVRIGWCDAVEVKPADTIRMTCSDPEMPTGDENLCIRAAKVLADRFGVRSGVHIHLEKRIPVGAGLGGGSSDAAATLLMLSRMWDLQAEDTLLATIGARLGADVPFFLGPSPAYAEGIGERLSPLTASDGDLVEFPFTFVVVKPARSVSTAEAYRLVALSDIGRADLRAVVRSLDLARWRKELTNDFEDSVSARLPEIKALKERLYAEGAGFAAMSGSGSAVFGVFEDEDQARSAVSSLGGGDNVCWVGKAL